MKINKYKNIILSAVILAAANLTFADEAPQTRKVNNPELKFEWSSITPVFKNELKNDASDAWNLCKTQIMNQQISKADLSKRVYGLMKVDDPKNNASEKLARARVADCLTGRLSRYMDDQKMKNPPVDEIVNTVLDMLQGKEEAVPQTTDTDIPNYVAQYNKALGAALALTNYVNEVARVAQFSAPTSASGGLVDMDELARDAASKMIENVRNRGEKVQGELKTLMDAISTNLNSNAVARRDKAEQALQQLQNEINTLETNLKNQIEKQGKDLKERAKAEKDRAKAEKDKEAEKEGDRAVKRIEDFLLDLAANQKAMKTNDFISSLKTNTTANVAVKMLRNYQELEKSAKIDNDESHEKVKARVIKVLDELYGSK